MELIIIIIIVFTILCLSGYEDEDLKRDRELWESIQEDIKRRTALIKAIETKGYIVSDDARYFMSDTIYVFSHNPDVWIKHLGKEQDGILTACITHCSSAFELYSILCSNNGSGTKDTTNATT